MIRLIDIKLGAKTGERELVPLADFRLKAGTVEAHYFSAGARRVLESDGVGPRRLKPSDGADFLDALRGMRHTFTFAREETDAQFGRPPASKVA